MKIRSRTDRVRTAFYNAAVRRYCLARSGSLTRVSLPDDEPTRTLANPADVESPSMPSPRAPWWLIVFTAIRQIIASLFGGRRC